jgi:hypothetical protein
MKSARGCWRLPALWARSSTTQPACVHHPPPNLTCSYICVPFAVPSCPHVSGRSLRLWNHAVPSLSWYPLCRGKIRTCKLSMCDSIFRHRYHTGGVGWQCLHTANGMLRAIPAVPGWGLHEGWWVKSSPSNLEESGIAGSTLRSLPLRPVFR